LPASNDEVKHRLRLFSLAAAASRDDRSRWESGREPRINLMVKFQGRTSALVALIAAASLVACAATELVNQWTNPAYTSPSFKKIMIIGVARQASIRRTFEDEFVSQLKAAGVDAVPSYRYVQEEGPVEEGRLKQAVTQAGADAAIITRLVKREQKTEITPGFYQPTPAYGFYGWYRSGWTGYYEPPRVRQYEVYTSETSLYDMTKNEVVWTGTAQTISPGDINEELKSYAEIMIRALKEKRLI
jgi:Domain of unknown function (DUF4136)